MTAQIELIARQAAASTSTCRTFEPDVCGGCNGRLEAARATAKALTAQPAISADESAPAHWTPNERAAYDCGLIDGKISARPAISAEQVEAAARQSMFNGAKFIRDNQQGNEAFAIEGGLFFVRDFLTALGLTVAGESDG